MLITLSLITLLVIVFAPSASIRICKRFGIPLRELDDINTYIVIAWVLIMTGIVYATL